jgi:hypothetical protein
MSIHEGFLDLAAASIDFDLDEYERAELDRHVSGCDDCRRATAAFRDDAAAIASGARPRLAAARSVEILADVLRPPKRSPRLRRLTLAAVVVLGVGLGAAALSYVRSSRDPIVAARSSPGPPGPGTSVDPIDRPTHRPGMTALSPAGSPRPVEPPASGALPVRASGQELGTEIRMAPGPWDDLYVSIPRPDGSVLVTLIDSTGRSRAGWPIVLDRTTSCDQLLPVIDGSVRLLCTPSNDDADGRGFVRAYAFASDGSSLPGWPIDLDRFGADGYFAGRVTGDELTVLAWTSLGDQIAAGQPAGNAWIMAIAADGTVDVGTRVSYGSDCCIDTWVVGPEAVAYGTVHHFADTRAGARSELVAIGASGVPAGFPITIIGSASRPATDAAGLIHVTVGTPNERPAGTLVFDAAGRTVDVSSGQMEIAATGEFVGTSGSRDIPVAPLVGRDGTTFVVDLSGGTTTVAGVNPSGQLMAGWPYRSDVAPQLTGVCHQGSACARSSWGAPAIGPDNILYLLNAAARSTAGGSIVAVGQDGAVVAGWPVGLRRAGSELWSVVVAPTGTAYALAVEPEPNRSHSATILSLAPDSTVLYTRTIVEP